ncbi:MAG TPA: tol-pal system protein YbgF [Thermoanaerobaculia bacterium]|nr:tol-pal system protein YbgF [Thermoanaerobaculia bacterium]
MKKLLCVAALLATACASSQDDNDVPSLVPPAPMAMPSASAPAASDSEVSELRTQLTELLERIDVLNQRIAHLEEGAPDVGRASARPAAPEERRAEARPTSAPAPQQPQQPQRALIGAQLAEEYRQAIILFGRGRHAEARRAFEAVYESDNSGDLADNALFWIGETYFAAKDYNNAVRYYMRVVNDYPSQNKAPDALFKTAMVQTRTGDLALARRTLQQVIDRYPYSSSASSAKAELERIKF